MKKVLLGLVLIAGIGSFTSCTKEYRCSCKVYAYGVHNAAYDSEVTTFSNCSDWEKDLQLTWIDGMHKVKCEEVK